jgi:hypothetical protein
VLIGRRATLVAPFGEMMQEFDTALARVHTSGSAKRGGTGDARAEALHETGSPARPNRQRQSRSKPSSPKPYGSKPSGSRER